jgi:alanine racemase
MFRATHLRIDTQSLRHNLQLLKKWSRGEFFCPMVKANAYGHGDVLVARVAEEAGVSALGVALVEEGVRLREAGLKAPILTFAPLSVDAVKAANKFCLTPVITRFEDLQALDRAGSSPTAVHLKFNTGMQRLGFDTDEIPKLKAELKSRPWVKIEGVCTHLTHGKEAGDGSGPSQTQLRRFLEMCKDFPGVRHGHKSASLASLMENHNDGIGARPGISIYGLPHDGKQTGAGLKPVLSWKTRIARVHTVEKGESASYSARWTAERRSVIGVLPVGYGDGYMRALSNKASVLFRGQRVRVVGSVCMDYTMVDLTDSAVSGLPQAGDEVTLIGEQGGQRIEAAELAELAGTIAYEVVTAISARVAREAF